MNTRMALFAALSGSMLGMAGTARAEQTFTALEMDIVCPGFDNDKKGPDKDDQPLWDLSRRVFQGAVMGEKEACEHIKTGEEGWMLAKVIWSSRNNANLYTETTAMYIGERDPKVRRFELFLDGNGSAAEFRKMYVDAGTNIMNEAGLTVTVKVAAKSKSCKSDYWADNLDERTHAGKGLVNITAGSKTIVGVGTSFTALELMKPYNNVIVVNGVGYLVTAVTDATHATVETANGGVPAVTVAKAAYVVSVTDEDDFTPPGNNDLMLTQQTLKPVPWALWALHSADSTQLQVQIDGLVRSVSGAAPITSTGGINPVIGLAPCGEGEGYVFTNGQWTCSAGNGVAKARAVYNRNQANCGAADNLLTTASSCSYDTGCKFDSPPACADGCNFSQTSTSQVCTRPRYNCDPFGGCTIVGCDAYQTQICGSCACPYQFAGYTIK